LRLSRPPGRHAGGRRQDRQLEALGLRADPGRRAPLRRSFTQQARYARGVTDELVLGALDAAEAGISDAERREDLYVSSLAAYVEALGGHVEVSAVFDDDRIVVRRDPP
jgi:hypothetical protein